MLNDVIMTPMRITRTQNKCNTIMTQLSKSIIDKSWKEYRGRKRRSRKVRELSMQEMMEPIDLDMTKSVNK